MRLNGLTDNAGSSKKRMRVGRGIGSGKGKTGGRGVKGQKARTGVAIKGFEGGQMPLQRRVPKFGFTNINRVEYKGINLDVLATLLEKHNVATMDSAYFIANGLVSKNAKIKILGRGEIATAVEVHAHAFSKSAVEAIEKAGGKAVTL